MSEQQLSILVFLIVLVGAFAVVALIYAIALLVVWISSRIKPEKSLTVTTDLTEPALRIPRTLTAKLILAGIFYGISLFSLVASIMALYSDELNDRTAIVGITLVLTFLAAALFVHRNSLHLPQSK